MISGLAEGVHDAAGSRLHGALGARAHFMERPHGCPTTTSVPREGAQGSRNRSDLLDTPAVNLLVGLAECARRSSSTRSVSKRPLRAPRSWPTRRARPCSRWARAPLTGLRRARRARRCSVPDGVDGPKLRKHSCATSSATRGRRTGPAQGQDLPHRAPRFLRSLRHASPAWPPWRWRWRVSAGPDHAASGVASRATELLATDARRRDAQGPGQRFKLAQRRASRSSSRAPGIELGGRARPRRRPSSSRDPRLPTASSSAAAPR